MKSSEQSGTRVIDAWLQDLRKNYSDNRNRFVTNDGCDDDEDSLAKDDDADCYCE